MIIHQSAIKSWHRCGEQHRRELQGDEGQQLSRTAYGSVMHHALHTLERHGDLQMAIDTFTWYWHPHRIDAICRPVDIWIGRDTQSSLAQNGVETLKRYWDLKRFDDDEELLALEISFVVPIHGTYDPDTGKPHYLAGTIDRLALRKYTRRPHVCVDDYKTGRKQPYLKHNLQGTGYSYATTQPEFWTGSEEFLTEGFGIERGRQLYERTAQMPRKFYWITIAGSPTFTSGGVRTDRDYARFRHAVQQYAEARRQGIYPLNIDGEICQYCPFNDDCPEGLDERMAAQHEALATGAYL